MDGFMEGNGYQVTWTFGHLCELKEPNDYSPLWKKWSLSQLPMIPPRFGIKLKSDKGVEKQFQTIARLIAHADGIINCGDAGQEGELIQRWVMQLANARCPVKRLWINSLTEESIRQGFQELKDQAEYQTLYEAGLMRAIGDWLLGMNATRLYTQKYAAGMNQVLSVGRVQTPTLALIVARQKEIENFVPVPYWVLSTLYRDTVFTAVMKEGDRGIATREEGEAALDAIRDLPMRITDVQRKKGTEAPPRLFDLTSLQVECNKKFGFSADTTLQLIQSLYEKKFTTYPRVDTQYLPDDVYPTCPQILNGVYQSLIAGQSVYAPLVKPLGGKPLPKTKKVFDASKVTDHHAIIPTGVPIRGLTDIEQNVFDLIARRFIAVFYPDCRFSTTTVQGKVEDVTFKVSGKEILDPGWRKVYGKEAKQQTDDEARKTDEERVLPQFTVGESGPHEPTLTEKHTTPPKYYTEATLLRAMETAGKFVEDEELRAALKENGIGRPSSRAGIIETLFKRRYIRRERKNLVATPTGIGLIDIIREELLKSCELTGIWEKKLRDIEHQRYDAAQFVAELKQQITDIVKDVLQDASPRRLVITDDATEQVARKPKSRKAAPKATKPKPNSAKSSDGQQPAIAPSDDLIGKPCPLCGKGVVIKGRTAYGCSLWREGCAFKLPFG